ncbi:type VI secretion system membrane subunit TssM [Scleromatobacter humisilvae]|uniref:Type VI secretion system membrane subunit TssM n=1 Tax=Scleromatobacter humisilvae TaxID=2897159 RepID=A0A9X2C366_9BURK|nr:type VI secretion system membrane subunit TssM [Scleromatobacter humisilvae]MCK9689731.1 type VI secretion system membrane subunit TssM [Scleromatobacter humisilvae]
MWAKLKSFFANRWVLAFIGLLVVSLLIWFVGDAIAFYDHRPLGSAGARIGLIVLVWLVFALVEGLKQFRAWRANKAMLAAMGEGASSNSALSQREVAELKKRFDDAMATLRKARFEDKSGSGRNYLYQLPWYMFIGAPGSGKTTALVNSGLRFPLEGKMGKDAVKGIGGTRNCDWWFTDEAVLLDTAGRYTTQSSNREVDAAAWTGFLTLLKKFRPAQPLNGAIVTVSLSDLFTSSSAQRDEYARSIRARIQELYSTLGVRFPIYVVVTKCDLLAGFAEFFGDLGREARAQVWGTTFDFPLPAGANLGATFAGEFDALVARLNARLTTRMEEERDPQRRATLFAFPQQFAGLRDMLKAFLDEAFLSSAFTEEPMVRGVYFTSGTQEGSPFDRVLGNISRVYGLERQVLPPASSSGRSYFLTHLLRGVIFAESDISGRSAVIEKRRGRVALALYSLLALLSLLLIVGWTISFVRNQVLIKDVAEASAEVTKQVAAVPPLPTGDVTTVLPVLDAARNIPTGYADRDAGVPMSRAFGLSQSGKLGTQADRAYLNLLRDVFLPRIALRLEQQIREANSPEVRYEALKTYVMLYDPAHLKAADVKTWISADWDRTLSRDITQLQRASLLAHLGAALDQLPLEMVLPQDQALVQQVRTQLAAASLAQRTYSRLKRIGVEGVPDFRVTDAGGPQAALVFTRASGAPLSQGVPALFTVAGYDKGFRAQAPLLVKQLGDEEAWVLGTSSNGSGVARMATTLTEVQQLYLNEYIKSWDDLLGDLRLIQSSSLQGSIQTITLLSAGDSPLKLLLNGVAKETKLATGNDRSAEAAAAGLLDKATAAMRSTADKLMGTPAASAQPAAKPEAVVDAHFEQLQRVVAGPAGQPVPLDATLGVLKEYEVQLRATDEAIKRGAPVTSDALIVARIKSEADRMPPPVSNLLNGLISRSGAQSAGAGAAAVKAAAAGEVGSWCKPAVEGRYPFVKGVAKEVPLGDFAKLFAPNGVIDGFAKTKLVGMVDMSGPLWKPIQIADGVDALPPAAIANFQRAATIRDAFFPGGAANPQASLDLLLQRVDDGVTDVQLSIDGQVSSMKPGTNAAARLSWPSLSPASQIKLTLVIGGKPSTTPLIFDGPWALFRFVDAGKVEGGTPERQSVSYAEGGKQVFFELRSGSVRNPMRLPELAQFRCPG